jgi:hypothetical protein
MREFGARGDMAKQIPDGFPHHVLDDDPRRDTKLREMQRRAVGEAMAARTRQKFLAKAPDGFRGRVQAGPEGTPCARAAFLRRRGSSRRCRAVRA